MKLFLSLLCLVLISVSVHAQLPNSLTNGLIAFYPFDGNGNDASGNGRNLVLGENTFTNGIRGQSISVYGANRASYGESRELPLLITNSFSFSLWMKPETLNRGWPEWIYLISGNAEITNASLRIGVNDGSVVPSFRNLGMDFINGGRGGDLSSWSTTNTASLKTNAWNHIVVTANGTNEIAVYANNQLLERWTNVPNFFFDQNNYILGNASGTQYSLQGQLDEIRVYNRALSSSEVAALYKQDVPLSQILPTVNIETVFVGDAGNAPDTTGFGSVSYPFHIGKFEVTIEQYAAFLNSVASSDPYGLYNEAMSFYENSAGISRSGSSGSYEYVPIGPFGVKPQGASGSGNRPIVFVSWFDAARFANWMHNGATNGASTEFGAYTLDGATNGPTPPRNAGAKWWIPTENEWYKAAYYKGSGLESGYWQYPTQSDLVPSNSISAAANHANFQIGDVYAVTQTLDVEVGAGSQQNYLTEVGVFSGSASAYGTFDQGGNVYEWHDGSGMSGARRGLRGGAWYDPHYMMVSANIGAAGDPAPDVHNDGFGFRLATRESSAMVVVKGGVLPSSSELSGQSVNSFRIGRTEITWGEWKQVSDWAVANGYTDLSNIGIGGSDNHPVRLVNWYDAVKWCNAKSEKEGLQPVYLRSGQVYRQGEGPSDSPYDPNSPVQFVIDRDSLANGYRLPTDAEWEWAARGGVSSRDFIYSGSDDLNAVGWFTDNSSGAPAAFLNGRGTYPVGLKQPNELGIYDMSGNASEWVWDPLGDWRRVRGGAFHYLAEQCVVSRRSADAAGYRDSDTYVKGGFRVTRKIPTDFDSDEDGVNDYREGKDGTNPNDANSFNPLSKGLVAYYPFNGNAKDESGYGNDGTVQEAVLASDRNGLDAQAYSFDGVDDCIKIQPSHSLTAINGSVSVVAWIKSNGSPTLPSYGSQDLQGIFGPATWLVSDGGFFLRLFDEVYDAENNRKYDFAVSSPYVGGQSLTVAPTNSWDFVVASYDGNTVRIYRNGALDASQAVGGLTATLNSDGRFYTIGQCIDWAVSVTQPFHGKIDGVRVYNRALSSSDVETLFYSEAFTDTEQQFLVSTPWVMGHYSQANYLANRTNGQTDVTTNPSAFNLFTQAQFDGNRTAGQSDVISNPMLYGLYNSESIMDLRMGGLMLQRQGNNATVIFQTQTTTDLATQPFTNNGTPITNTVPMPSNKGFLRIQVK